MCLDRDVEQNVGFGSAELFPAKAKEGGSVRPHYRVPLHFHFPRFPSSFESSDFFLVDRGSSTH